MTIALIVSPDVAVCVSVVATRLESLTYAFVSPAAVVPTWRHFVVSL